MSKTVSPRQLAANRANALRSTGPRTARGKAISSQNARKHGLAACGLPAPVLEGFDDLAGLRADLIAVYKPANCQELYAIERIAAAQQHILRAARLESGLFSACLIHAGDNPSAFDDPGLQMTPAQRENLALAEGFHNLAASSPTWRLFLRYQAQNERLYRRAIEDFERLKSLRAEFAKTPNEPVFDSQPQARHQFPPSRTNRILSLFRRQVASPRKTGVRPPPVAARIGEPEDMAEFATWELGPQGTLPPNSVRSLHTGVPESLESGLCDAGQPVPPHP